MLYRSRSPRRLPQRCETFRPPPPWDWTARGAAQFGRAAPHPTPGSELPARGSAAAPGRPRAPLPGTHRSPALRRSPGHGRGTTFPPSPPARALLPLQAGRDVIPARRIGVASQSGAVQSARRGAARFFKRRRRRTGPRFSRSLPAVPVDEVALG